MTKSTFVIDVDGTICLAKEIKETKKFDYVNATPINHVIEKIRKLKAEGHSIVLHTSRGMKTYEGNVNLINEFVRPVMEKWLETHEVPYDKLVLGKPWGPNVYYIDDRCLSPLQFAYNNEYQNIIKTNITTL